MSTRDRSHTGAPLFCKPSHTVREPYPNRQHHGPRAVGTCVISPDVVRDQQVFGSCVGQASGFAVSRHDFVASGAFLWIEGRRVDLDLSGVDDGTNYDSVFAVLENTGAAPYSSSENDPTPENWDRAKLGPHLDATMAAADHKFKLKISSINPADSDAFDRVCDAIASNARVVFASGLKDPFFDLAPGEIATSRHIGGDSNGHAQAFCGFDRSARDVFALNSWGAFAGLRLLKSDYRDPPAWPLPVIDRGDAWELPGAYRLDAEALACVWEIFVIEIVR